jgi:branched-chain amino acid transport system ATP-binding protein
MMLEATDLHVDHHGVVALSGVSIHVAAGELVSLVGANGAGKSSLLATLSGLHRPRRGRVMLNGQDITRRPAHEITALGVSLVPEGRRLFGRQTVSGNLRLGAHLQRDHRLRATTLAGVLDLFPALRSRLHQPARVLSGGEQQMLALGRALMCRPRLLMLDEPSLGLAPRMVAALLEAITAIRRSGTTVLLVEQNLRAALELSDRLYVLRNGSIVGSGTPGDLRQSALIRRGYLGF